MNVMDGKVSRILFAILNIDMTTGTHQADYSMVPQGGYGECQTWHSGGPTGK